MPRWAAASLLAVMLLLGALGSQSYLGRVHIRQDAVRGCIRSTLDRHVNARGWRIAQQARFASYELGGAGAVNDLRASVRYDVIATSLESRTRPTPAGRAAFCDRAFPAPSIVPWKA